MTNLVFLKCETCGNMVVYVKRSGVPVMCCGKKMEELVPGAVDAALEKHVPAVHAEGQTVEVKVGSVPHPMAAEHYIEWVALETQEGNVQIKYLSPGQDPSCVFVLSEGETLQTVYAYCNIHGLWKADRPVQE